MPTRRILIVYGTRYGQTARIASCMANMFLAADAGVMLLNADRLPRNAELPHDFSPIDFDGIVVGSSVIGGRHQRSIRRFVAAHRDALNVTPSAFFSVSGSAASKLPAHREAAWRIVRDFLRDTGWRPDLTASLAGAIAYTKYNPIVRWILKRISAKEGGPTDTSRDHELTDWAQVHRFVESVLEKTAPTVITTRSLATV